MRGKSVAEDGRGKGKSATATILLGPWTDESTILIKCEVEEAPFCYLFKNISVAFLNATVDPRILRFLQDEPCKRWFADTPR